MEYMTKGKGVLPGSFFQLVQIHNRWRRIESLESYVQACVNCRYEGGVIQGVDRAKFVRCFALRVKSYAELGRWRTHRTIGAGEIRDAWRLDNAIFTKGSPYYMPYDRAIRLEDSSQGQELILAARCLFQPDIADSPCPPLPTAACLPPAHCVACGVSGDRLLPQARHRGEEGGAGGGDHRG